MSQPHRFRPLLQWFFVVACLATTTMADADDSLDLSPRIDADTYARVTVELDGGGNDLVRILNPQKSDGAEQKLPMSVSAKLEYDERWLDEPADPSLSAPIAIRDYKLAEAVIKVDTSGATPSLAEDRRLIVVESGGPRPTLYSPAGPIEREQLDVIDAIGNSRVIDQLLPAATVSRGATWANDAATMGPLLGLDSVAVCEVQSALDEFNASFAKIRLAGVVHGTADGAATQQEIRGVYLFDRRLHRITRLNLAVREMRSIGGATPGLQGVAKLQITIEPIKASPRLTDDVVAAAKAAQSAAGRNLFYESGPLGFRVEHDRQWFITSEARETVTLRRVERSDVVAQCTVTLLPPKSAGRQTTLNQFQKDVQYSLGKNFGQLISSRQWANTHGHRCFEVVVRGNVEELPVEWHFFLVAPEEGHRVSLAFMMEAPMIDRINRADRMFVEALQLVPPTKPAAVTASRPESPSAAEATK